MEKINMAFMPKYLRLIVCCGIICAYTLESSAAITWLIPRNNCRYYASGAVYCNEIIGDEIPILCAPEVKQGNVAVIEEAVNSLIDGPLKGEDKFIAEISKLKELPLDQKIGAYLAIADIKSDLEIAAFVGGREIDQKHINAFAKNNELTEEQSKLALQEIAKALLGNRQ